ncbi:MAG: primosomal protein N', partial [Eubacteriales bacterium]|nr:primosomal protein N' [Eubacteriales bacterium]
MIARVAVRDTDGVFDYKLPVDMEQYATVGIRVVVPFGASSRITEGIITEICDTSEFSRLKTVKQLLDTEPLCTEELLELASWMKDNYFCNYYTALRCVMPPGVAYRVKRTIKIIDADATIKGAKRKVLDEINRGKDNWNDFSTAERNHITEMVTQGILSIEEKGKESIKSKTAKTVQIIVDRSEVDEIIAHLAQKAPVQARILEVLSQADYMSLADLSDYASGANSAVRAMEKKGLVVVYEKQQVRNAFNVEDYTKTQPNVPTREQKVVLKALITASDKGQAEPFLLHGVTGSGKTEVFLQLIDHAMKQGKQAIVLVPEISLTPQMVERFVGRFGQRVSVLHSSLSAGERFDEWQKILSGEVSLVVGARSAVFAPFNNLGVIIMDEEQENTYKSESNPLYHAREVALKRCASHNALLLMASATPAVESMYKAKKGEYKLLTMTKRYNEISMPKVEIANMCQEMKNGNRTVFSKQLIEMIQQTLARKEKTILFLNRRGYNTFVSCRTCGEAIKCEHCDITMTYHKRVNKMICHYCGCEKPVPQVCPQCTSPYIRYFGDGTQKLEDELSKMFDGIKFLRMDMDTTTNKNSHEAILRRFRDEDIDVLIGTQMVTKGLDFPQVTLVGVMAADLSLNMGDYRAYERTFSLLTQVCGRAGRGEIEGRAVIQTYQPDNFVIQLACDH